ncbi:flagellar basal body P-ring formation protein FlgA [Marivibrio halodurans]|uniref:Flagellar basal body P-ring formation protein FlgA n=1 Tax=Marivibrio halodurans TaxID=2039722 RepID=A0A8J7V230_9PROT|nr:flagellar basal body P-ring formation chaperone FlgA [Marivibrio halodurans]MBP5856950.1 flagellar basal body P-ring formation protein FlgA [Marivibrio halodurans]
MTRLNLLTLIYALVLAGFMLAVTAQALPALAASAGPKNGEEPKAPAALVGSSLEATGEFVTLGDIFTNAGRYADRNVARTPQPGETLVMEAVWLWRLARGYGVDWRPTSTLDTVTVTRPSRTVSTDELRDLVRAELFKRTGEDDLIAIDLDDEEARLALNRDAVGEPRVKTFALDQKSGRFTAVIQGPASDAQRQVTIAGRAVPQIEVSVPVDRIASGHILRDSDLETVRLPAARVSRTALVHAADMVGQEATRTLSAGQPIANASLRPPELVRRDARVTITLETENMRLTAIGRAMQSGAEGEVVRVQNLQSRITIDAVVTGENRVRAELPARLAANGDM